MFWSAPGGGIEDGEDAMVATRRIYEATGLRDLELEAEVWHPPGRSERVARSTRPECRPVD